MIYICKKNKVLSIIMRKKISNLFSQFSQLFVSPSFKLMYLKTGIHVVTYRVILFKFWVNLD